MPDNNGVQYTNPPQSRNEAILESIITGDPYTAPPQSRIEDLLIQIKEAGGGGGTTVIANPEETGSEEKLEGLQVGSTKFKVATIDDLNASSNSAYSSSHVDATFANKEKAVDVTWFDFTSATGKANGSKNKLFLDMILIPKGRTIKSVKVSHTNNSTNTATIVVCTRSGSTLTPIYTKSITYGGSGTSTTFDVGYTPSVDCYVGIAVSEDNYVMYSTAMTTDVVQATPSNDVYTVASETYTLCFCYNVVLSSDTDIAYENNVLEISGSKAQITVAQDGTGDVTTINDALAYLTPTRNIIYVKNGTYEEEVDLHLSTYPVWLIGEDRDLTILKSGLAAYATPPLYHNNGGIKNMTVMAYDDGVHSVESGGCYAIHCDASRPSAREFIVDNCHLVSYWSGAIGIGLAENYKVEIRNSRLEGLTSLPVNSGALIVHNQDNVNKAGQEFVLENCTLYSSHNTKAIAVHDLEGASGSMDIKLVNNSFFNEASGNGNDAVFLYTKNEGTAWQNTACVTLNGLSYGNSAPMFNYGA